MLYFISLLSIVVEKWSTKLALLELNPLVIFCRSSGKVHSRTLSLRFCTYAQDISEYYKDRFKNWSDLQITSLCIHRHPILLSLINWGARGTGLIMSRTNIESFRNTKEHKLRLISLCNEVSEQAVQTLVRLHFLLVSAGTDHLEHTFLADERGTFPLSRKKNQRL